jgi:hypothetical protein
MVVRRLHAERHMGQKSSPRYHRYDGRKLVEDESALQLFQSLATELRMAHCIGISNEEIVERHLDLMVNERKRILDEGNSQHASDLDIVWTAAHGTMSGDHHGYSAVSPLLAWHANEARRLTARMWAQCKRI